MGNVFQKCIFYIRIIQGVALCDSVNHMSENFYFSEVKGISFADSDYGGF